MTPYEFVELGVTLPSNSNLINSDGKQRSILDIIAFLTCVIESAEAMFNMGYLDKNRDNLSETYMKNIADIFHGLYMYNDISTINFLNLNVDEKENKYIGISLNDPFTDGTDGKLSIFIYFHHDNASLVCSFVSLNDIEDRLSLSGFAGEANDLGYNSPYELLSSKVLYLSFYIRKAAELTLLDLRKEQCDLNKELYDFSKDSKFLQIFKTYANFNDLYCKTTDPKYNTSNSKHLDYLDMVRELHISNDIKIEEATPYPLRTKGLMNSVGTIFKELYRIDNIQFESDVDDIKEDIEYFNRKGYCQVKLFTRKFINGDKKHYAIPIILVMSSDEKQNNDPYNAIKISEFESEDDKIHYNNILNWEYNTISKLGLINNNYDSFVNDLFDKNAENQYNEIVYPTINSEKKKSSMSICPSPIITINSDNSLFKSSINDMNDLDYEGEVKVSSNKPYNPINTIEDITKALDSSKYLINLINALNLSNLDIKDITKDLYMLSTKSFSEFYKKDRSGLYVELNELFNPESFIISITSNKKIVDAYIVRINDKNRYTVISITNKVKSIGGLEPNLTKTCNYNNSPLSINISSIAGFCNLEFIGVSKHYGLENNAYKEIMNDPRLRYDLVTLSLSCIYNAFMKYRITDYNLSKNNNEVIKDFDTIKIMRILDKLVEEAKDDVSKVRLMDKFYLISEILKNYNYKNPDGHMDTFDGDSQIISVQFPDQHLVSAGYIQYNSDDDNHKEYELYSISNRNNRRFPYDFNIIDLDDNKNLLAIESLSGQLITDIISKLIKIFNFYNKCILDDINNNIDKEYN